MGFWSEKRSGFAGKEKTATFVPGEVAEWSIAAVLKTVELRGSGGSNPSLSATKFFGVRIFSAAGMLLKIRRPGFVGSATGAVSALGRTRDDIKRYLCAVRCRQQKGEMPEWSIGPHSKCGVRATVPGVRIPLSPRKPGKDTWSFPGFVFCSGRRSRTSGAFVYYFSVVDLGTLARMILRAAGVQMG